MYGIGWKISLRLQQLGFAQRLPHRRCLNPTAYTENMRVRDRTGSTVRHLASEQVRVSLIPPPPPAPSPELPGWSPDVWASSLDSTRKVFCNRSLNMASVKAIGFDMDYTLAQYMCHSFEVLAYELTVQKLVDEFGYPEVLLELEFDWQYMMRGLVIDKKRGNILKVDRHKYVKIAYHGFSQLPRQERLNTYAHSQVMYEYDEPDFALIDTLFSLAEAYLFMQLVEMHDTNPGLMPGPKTNADLYRDVRAAVDRCHRDGSLKNAVAADPAKYIHEDPRLLQLLSQLRKSGRGLFLATNSLWDYTSVVMNFLLTDRTGSQRNTDWLHYFDVVITGCGKPAFFTDRSPLFEVMPDTGHLQNTDGGSAMVPIGDADMPSPSLASSAPRFEAAGVAREAGGEARVYQGGCTQDLHKMLGIESGNQVLYVGDHIYGDILRSKKTLGWRTMLVVPEMAAELAILAKHTGVTARLKTLRMQREVLEDQIQRLHWALDHGREANGSSSQPDWERQLQQLEDQRSQVREEHRALLAEHHGRFHSTWGQLLKTGYQNSRFAHQVERFACLYTSHVSNMSFYSPDKCYRARMDHMAHEEDPIFSSSSC